MGTKALIFAGIALIGLLTYSTVLKIKENSQQAFSVVTWNKYNICFLVPDTFELEKQGDGFKYRGEKNTGHLVLSEGIIEPDYTVTTIVDFKAGYKKVKNLRYFIYQIAPNIVIKDTFDFIKKKPANIIPVRKNCEEYLKRFKIRFEL